jgi:hypothetical protein
MFSILVYQSEALSHSEHSEHRWLDRSSISNNSEPISLSEPLIPPQPGLLKLALGHLPVFLLLTRLFRPPRPLNLLHPRHKSLFIRPQELAQSISIFRNLIITKRTSFVPDTITFRIMLLPPFAPTNGTVDRTVCRSSGLWLEVSMQRHFFRDVVLWFTPFVSPRIPSAFLVCEGLSLHLTGDDHAQALSLQF